MGDLRTCSLADLAVVATDNWDRPSAEARPYLTAMLLLQTLDDAFGPEPAVEVVSDFLSHAHAWRGTTAQGVKAELRRRLRERYH